MFLGQSAIFHDDESARFMALIFGRADRETYGNAIGLRLARNTVSNNKHQEICLEQVPNQQRVFHSFVRSSAAVILI